jgi:hypothetical protein
MITVTCMAAVRSPAFFLLLLSLTVLLTKRIPPMGYISFLCLNIYPITSCITHRRPICLDGWIPFGSLIAFRYVMQHFLNTVHDLKVPFRVLSLELDIRPRPYVTAKRAFMI